MGLDGAGILDRMADLLGIASGRGRDARLAERLGVASNTVSAWRRGARDVDVAMVLDLTRANGWSLDWIMLGVRPADAPPATDAPTTGWRRPTEEELERAGAQRIDPDEGWNRVERYSTPADMASLFLQRILAVQDRQRDELREEMERFADELARR